MNNKRFYGNPPYKTIFLHGGPGGIGELRRFSKEFYEFSNISIIEDLESNFSIDGLINDLFQIIKDNCDGKVTFVGHSFGGWLSAFFTEKYPDLINKLILIDMPPLTDEYVPLINKNRLEKLDKFEREIFKNLSKKDMDKKDLNILFSLLEKTDNFQIENPDLHKADKMDKNIHDSIWKESEILRSNGKILDTFKNINKKIYIIQGSEDPHPIEGVVQPLRREGIDFEAFLFERCGHSPFKEKYIKKEFFQLLKELIEND